MFFILSLCQTCTSLCVQDSSRNATASSRFFDEIAILATATVQCLHFLTSLLQIGDEDVSDWDFRRMVEYIKSQSEVTLSLKSAIIPDIPHPHASAVLVRYRDLGVVRWCVCCSRPALTPGQVLTDDSGVSTLAA